MTTEFKITLDPTDHRPIGNKVERRVVLTLADGQQPCSESVRLDKEKSITELVRRWAKRYGINRKTAAEQLRKLNIRVIADAAERQTQRALQQEKSAQLPRISEQADKFISSLNPLWHRNGKSLYCAAVEAEIPITQLWTRADIGVVDAVADTFDGMELANGGKPDFKQKLGLLKDAIPMAAARMLRKLPEYRKIEKDQTLDGDVLRATLTAWLLKERTFRMDNGTPVTTSYFAWAVGLRVDSGWNQCFTAPVFARMEQAGASPRIAVKGESLQSELRHESHLKLAAELREGELAKTNTTIRVTDNVWRVWEFTPKVILAVAEPDRGVTP